MKPSPSPKVIVILGPTASGKSSLGVALARQFNGEIISADSRQVYRGLNIGSGKITKREMRGIPHHLLDVASPRRRFTVTQFQKLGRTAMRSIVAKGKTPIIVGGTGFFIDALLYDYPLPSAKPDHKLRSQLDKKTAEELFARLQALDPRRAGSIDSHNKRRLIRALEIIAQTGQPVPAAGDALRKKSSYHVLKIGLRLPTETLQRNIHTRLLARLRQGMIGEVKKLRADGLGWQRLEDLGLEYRFVGRFLQKLISRQQMTEQLETEIRRYAKRQMTWFKRDNGIHWISTAQEAPVMVREFLGV